MKVFDFTNGKKGKMLVDFAAHTGTGHSLFRDDFVEDISGGKRVPKIGHMDFHWEVHVLGNRTIRPEALNVQAICFCLGKYDGEWMWCYSATREWLQRRFKAQEIKPMVKGPVDPEGWLF